MFLVTSQVDVFRQLLQDVRELLGVHDAEDAPGRTVDGDHHPVIGLRYLSGKVIGGDVLVDLLMPVARTQGRLHDGHSMVGHQSQAKAKQGRLGIAQRVDCTGQRFRQFLQHHCNRPTLAGTLRQLLGAGLPHRDIAQHVDCRIPIPCRLMQGHRHAAQQHGVALGVDETYLLFVDLPRTVRSF